MLEFLGWKDYRGRWDKTEIVTDLLVFGIIVVVVTAALILSS